MNHIQETGTQQVIDEFRANSGRVGGRYTDRRVLLLTAAARTTPLVYAPDHRPGAESRMLVVAVPDAGGAPPAWYGELAAGRRVEIETGTWSFSAEVEILGGAERDRLLARAAEADPDLRAAVRAATAGQVHVVALAPVDDGPPAGPLGDALVTIHRAFRQELALLRAEVARAAAGGAAAGGLVLQLRVNCLSFCHGLEFHHTGEDQQIFPWLAGQFPELAETFARLGREHEAVADRVDRLRALVGPDDAGAEDAGARDAAPAPPAAEVLGEVDRLVSELEAHLDYEEEHLVAALNAATAAR
ncbi:nitroreductase/quinone reductase family protein [Streptomyces sp. MAR4 CNX-425]|uniref:nitroreductase/quinone reductase family protein n=1 Tax=Streptomyces sp. MAR4 CNX-425 TaxID=3406343 RepID=UPI003B50DBA9